MPIAKSVAIVAASIPSLDVTLDVVEAEITLDDSRIPYAEARLRCHLPTEEVLEQVDPRDGLRVTVTAELSWDEPTKPDQERTFDLLLHGRDIIQEDATLQLVLESDEALLIDGGNVSAVVDSSAETYQESLRDIIDAVLGGHGAALEAGTADADFTITTDGVNLVSNPRAATATTNWEGGGGGGTITWGRVATGGPSSDCSTFIRTTTTNAGNNYVLTQFGTNSSTIIAVTAGATYDVSAWCRLSVAGTVYVDVQFYDAGGATLLDSTQTTIAIAATTWTRHGMLSLTAPAGSARAQVRAIFQPSAGNFAAGVSADTTGLRLTESMDTGITGDRTYYFDGSTPGDAHYSYAWTGTAHASTSTRTRLDNRSPELLKQEPGTTDWDFLDGLIRPAGLRLFCDETRAWRLVDPTAYAVDGTVFVSEGINATRGTDAVSLQSTRDDGSPTWYSGVVVRYTWTVDGATQVAYDVAGTSQKIWRVESDRPYPGPGEAAKRLALAQGRGRTQELEALADLNATPGMTLISSLPSTPTQVGTVSAVTWYWSAESDRHDVMSVRSRGLIDTPDTAWLFQPEGYAWEDVPMGVDWTEYDTP